MGIFTQKRGRVLLQVLSLAAFLLVMLPASSQAQTTTENQSEKSVFGLKKIEAEQVIRQIIELPELDKLLPVNDKTEAKQVKILSFPVAVPANLDLSVSGKEISIHAADNAASITNYLNFRTFQATENSLQVVANFFQTVADQSKVISIVCEFKKSDNNWRLTSHNINQR